MITPKVCPGGPSYYFERCRLATFHVLRSGMNVFVFSPFYPCLPFSFFLFLFEYQHHSGSRPDREMSPPVEENRKACDTERQYLWRRNVPRGVPTVQRPIGSERFPGLCKALDRFR